MILPWAFLGCIVPHSSLKHYRHLDGPAFYSEEKVRLPDNRSEGNTSNPSGGQVRWEERRRWILLMLWQLCQYKFISMYRTILVFKKQNSTSVVFMNSSLSRPPQEEQMNLVQTVCEMQNFWKSKMLSTDSFLDLISISSGLLFNGSQWHLTQLILRCNHQCVEWTERWDRDQILSATLKIFL